MSGAHSIVRGLPPTSGYDREKAVSVSLSYGWRVTELTSRRERRTLACSLEAAAREARQRPGPIGATVVSRATVRPYTAELTTLAERLADLKQPVSPTGMLLVRDLLTSPTSPLYEAVRAGELPATIANILRTLEVTDRPLTKCRARTPADLIFMNER